MAAEHGLELPEGDPASQTEALLLQSYAQGFDLISMDDIATQAQREVESLYASTPRTASALKPLVAVAVRDNGSFPAPKTVTAMP